jgi:hypothetical protein
MTNVINPYASLMAWQCRRFVLASNTKEERSRILYVTLRSTENYRVISKSGVNFQAALKRNRAKRNRVKKSRKKKSRKKIA